MPDPASPIQPRESVESAFHPGEVFYVFGVIAEADGTVLVGLADADLDERLDVEAKLFAIEHRVAG